MPNLLGLRAASLSLSMEDQEKENTKQALQMEALGKDRRDALSKTDFKENKVNHVSVVNLESRRLVNKSSIGEGERSKLEGWNNAWMRLHDDGTDVQNLQAINEGLGQTHRAKLMDDDSVRDYTGEESFRRGGRGGRLGRGDHSVHSGRSGSNARGATGRGGGGKAKGERRVTFQNLPLVQPVTRVRVPKGHPTAQIDDRRRQSAPVLKTVSAVKPAKGNSLMSSIPAPSIRRPTSRYDGELAAPNAFMASIGTRKEHAPDEPTVEVVPSVADISKRKAAGRNIDTSTTETTVTSSEKAMAQKSNPSVMLTPNDKTTIAAGKPGVSLNRTPDTELMDIEIDQETTQPVLQFTAPSTKEQSSPLTEETFSSLIRQIEALEKRGLLSGNHLDMLKAIQAQVSARGDATAPVKETYRQGTYTELELVSLRPAAVIPEVTNSIARIFAQQRDVFLIGEHVHKTRYHTAASLTEDLEHLSISDEKSVKPAATKPLTTGKSTVNPFDSPPAKGKGPSLPAHLLNQPTAADHGSAARAQYSGGYDILASISNRQSQGNFTLPTRPARRNMINQTGFIALAEHGVNSGR